MPGPNSDDTESRGTAVQGGGEFQAIARVQARLAASGPGPVPGEIWIGDDAAVVSAPASGRLLLTTDVVVAGVHGDLSIMGVADLGWRAMVASLSDVAAMGGVPGHALVSVAGPPGTDLDALYEGVAEASSAFGCPVVGGDLANAGQLTVSVAMTGALPAGSDAVLRSGAQPGDRIFLTGPLGASAAGLRRLRQRAASAVSTSSAASTASGVAPEEAAVIAAYLRPLPLLAHGTAARLGGARAMIDVSDGLAGDVGHVALASGVGFELTDVPVARGAELDDALYGGEDYQLVMVGPDGAALRAAFAGARLTPPIEIGVCLADPAVRTLAGVPLGPGSFEHRFD